MIKRHTLGFRRISLCILLFQAACLGADYYVDGTAGDDGNSGLSPTTAWRTVAKVNVSSFAPGDRILLRRGQVWREQLVVPSSGTADRPIVFGAYGVGDRPTLKGSALVQNWTAAGSPNIWRASLATQPNQVFLDGVRGTLESAVQNLDKPLEWCWSSGVLYVYAPSSPGVLYQNPGIEASVRPSTRSYGLIHIQNQEYVTIESIAVLQSYSFGIYIKPWGQYITVSDCEVGHSLDGGIVAPNSGGAAVSQITLLNCLVHHNNGGFKEGDPGVATYHEGITMEYVGGFTIRGCQVYNNYMEGVNFKRGATNGLVEGCTFYANDLIDQYIEGASNIEIRYNRIFDCTYNAGIEMGLETNTYNNDNINIHHNLFWGNSGAVSFWAGSVSAQTRNISICNNTFYNNEFAVHWKSGATDNYSGTNQIKNNLIWQYNDWYNGIKDDTSGQQAISRTEIAFNMFQQGARSDTLGTHALTVTDPGLVNASGNDFHLRAGSVCIDAGTNVGFIRDYDGNAIPQGAAPDIGAYEYVSDVKTYTLATSASGGTITRSPDKSSYAQGETVTVQAAPNAGYAFSGWSGDLAGQDNPATLTMDSNKSVTANFTANAYTLTLNAAHGSVTRDPEKSSYAYGETVTLQAAPDPGYRFEQWSGDASGTGNPTTITMTADRTVAATFAAVTYTLDVTGDHGSVSRTPDKAGYSYGETVTLQATPSAGYDFAGWSGDVTGSANPVSVVMDSNKSAAAAFTSTNTDQDPPVLAGCAPAPDSIQAPPNTLVSLHVLDDGKGVDPTSVSITVLDDPVYTGDVDSCRTATGVCHRSGSKADYTYTYQRDEAFEYSAQVFVAVNAHDLAGNTMVEQRYSFATEMYSFGRICDVAEDRTGLDQGRPAAMTDNRGRLWVAWQEGPSGARHIYVSRFSPDDGTSTGTTQLTQSTGDHCNPAMAADGTGTLYVVWQENARGVWNVCLSASTDASTWSAPKPIADSNDNQVNPVIAASRQSSGLAAVAWQDDGAGNQDIYAASSTNRFSSATISRLTSNGADQTDPAIAIDCEDTIFVLWTDARNSSTDIYGAASNNGPWSNVPIVNGSAQESQPAVAVGSTAAALHIVWVDNARGNLDVRYAATEGWPADPVAGIDIIDDTTGADQQAPAVAAVGQTTGPDRVFVCWQDARNVPYSGDTDLYFADVGPAALSTNVLVGERTNGNQNDASLGIDHNGFPYLVWAEDAGSNRRVCYAGTTYADPTPVARQDVPADSGGTVGVPPETIHGVNDVSVAIPAGACSFNPTVSIAKIGNPHGPLTESVGTYDFGPSGLTFSQPATITIPYGAPSSGVVRPRWYDAATGTFSDRGITNVQDVTIGTTLHALRFETTHFTPFYLVVADAQAPSDESGSGGCSLAAHAQGDILGYFVPYLLIAAAAILWRRRDANNIKG
jgi:uncharacterized repeat protein (TIGR02543 family)